MCVCDSVCVGGKTAAIVKESVVCKRDAHQNQLAGKLIHTRTLHNMHSQTNT